MAKTPTQNRVKSDRPRSARDFYETPYGLCRAYIDQFVNYDSSYPTVLDAGAGNGIWGKAIKAIYPGIERLIGVDLVEPPRSIYNERIIGDYLSIDPEMLAPGIDIIIGNPPYSLSEPFVRKSLEIVADYGQVHFLLPLAFLGSIKRRDGLFAERPPEFVTISSRRPSFFSTNGKHTTDALEYAMFQWNKVKSRPIYPSIRWFDWSYE